MDPDQIVPILDQILVQRDQPQVLSDGGLHIPEKAQARHGRGIVLRVGPGLRNEKTGQRIEPELKAGDHIVFSRLSGDSLERDLAVEADDRLLMIREFHVMCVIED